MTSQTALCLLCQKHQSLDQFCGEAIQERAGLLLTHFPDLEGAQARKGHLLIEPRRHITELTELTDSEASALGFLARDGAKIIKNILKAEHVYLFRINDKVAHLHFHLVPRYAGTPKEFWGPKIMDWNDPEKISLLEIKSLVKQLKNEI